MLDGPDGLTVVDSGVPMRAKEIFETVKRVGGKPVSRLINTHWHFDHAGGNEVFARAGATVLATAATRKRLATDQYTEVFKLTTPASPAIALPTLTSDEFELHVGAEVVHLTAVPPAHTDGDLIVHFTSRDVIHTGDLFSNGFYPNIDASSLGWIGGMISAADRILKLAGPKTRIIPGHGPMATPAELAAFRKMLVTVHDRLAACSTPARPSSRRSPSGPRPTSTPPGPRASSPAVCSRGSLTTAWRNIARRRERADRLSGLDGMARFVQAKVAIHETHRHGILLEKQTQPIDLEGYAEDEDCSSGERGIRLRAGFTSK